jgi:hypothetical protein
VVQIPFNNGDSKWMSVAQHQGGQMKYLRDTLEKAGVDVLEL